MKKLFIIIALTIFAFPGFFSCSTLSKLVQEPKVTLRSVELGGININGIELIVNVDVENINSFDIPFPKIDWQLFINSASFVKGDLSRGVSLKGRSTTTVPVHVSFTYSGLYNSFASMIELKEAAYDIALGITFPIPIIQEKTFNLEFSGKIPLFEIPKITPGAIRIAEMDFTGIKLAYSINVENPNSFPIPFPKIDWAYAVAGVPLLSSAIKQDDGQLAAGTTSPVDIIVGVNYADLIAAVPNLLNAGEAPSLLNLDTVYPIPGREDIKNVFSLPGTLPILRMPEVTVRSINRRELALLRFEFVVNMEIENRNSFDMNIERFNYDLRVNNTVWASGLFANPPVIRAGSRTALPLTVVLSTLPVIQSIRDIIDKGMVVEYNLTGDMIFSSSYPGLPRIDRPINITGTTRL